MHRVLRLGWRFIIVAIVNSLSLLMAVLLIPGITLERDPLHLLMALLFALIIGFVNALIRPMLVYLAYPVNALTVGIPTVIVDSILLMFVGNRWPGFRVDAFWPSAVLGAVVLPASNVLFHALTSPERGRTLYDWVIRRLGRRRPNPPEVRNTHGVVFVQIDGLSYVALRQALRLGWMPALETILGEGGHQLLTWESDVPSQTSSAQAGIMYGDNFDIPAFRFFDRAAGKVLVSNRPEGARLLEQRFREGYRGLLFNGSSLSNIFTGHAAQNLFTLGAGEGNPTRRVDDFLLFLLNPYCLGRVLFLTAVDYIRERIGAWRQRLRRESPRVSRRGLYPIIRIISNIVLREFSTYMVLTDILRGVPAIYVSYFGYDEVAHFAGPLSRELRAPLAGIDAQIQHIWKTMRRGAPIPYDLVLLSDHGQTESLPFVQLTGHTIQSLLLSWAGREGTERRADIETVELPGALVALLEDLRAAEQRTRGVVAPWALRGGRRVLEQYSARVAEWEGPDYLDSKDLLVLCSGPMAHVYFGDNPVPISLEDIERIFPMLLMHIARQKGVGFVLGRSQQRGILAVSERGFRQLETGTVVGEDPLAPFGNAEELSPQLLRLMRFPSAGDLVIHGGYADGRLVAFEGHIGTHGGYGGAQSHPFVMVPARMRVPPAAIRSAENLYSLFMALRDEGEAAPETAQGALKESIPAAGDQAGR